MILCICIHRVRKKTAQIPWKIRSNSWENFTHYYLFTCCIVVNVIVWEIGRGKQAAGQSRAPGRVMWTKCLPRDTIQPMESTLRNSNEIIFKHRNLRLQVPGKVVAECGLRLLPKCIPETSIATCLLLCSSEILKSWFYVSMTIMFSITYVWLVCVSSLFMKSVSWQSVLVEKWKDNLYRRVWNAIAVL